MCNRVFVAFYYSVHLIEGDKGTSVHLEFTTNNFEHNEIAERLTRNNQILSLLYSIYFVYLSCRPYQEY